MKRVIFAVITLLLSCSAYAQQFFELQKVNDTTWIVKTVQEQVIDSSQANDLLLLHIQSNYLQIAQHERAIEVLKRQADTTEKKITVISGRRYDAWIKKRLNSEFGGSYTLSYNSNIYNVNINLAKSTISGQGVGSGTVTFFCDELLGISCDLWEGKVSFYLDKIDSKTGKRTYKSNYNSILLIKK